MDVFCVVTVVCPASALMTAGERRYSIDLAVVGRVDDASLAVPDDDRGKVAGLPSGDGRRVERAKLGGVEAVQLRAQRGRERRLGGSCARCRAAETCSPRMSLPMTEETT